MHSFGSVNITRAEQHDRRYANTIFKCILLNGFFNIFVPISIKFVSISSGNVSALNMQGTIMRTNLFFLFPQNKQRVKCHLLIVFVCASASF